MPTIDKTGGVPAGQDPAGRRRIRLCVVIAAFGLFTLLLGLLTAIGGPHSDACIDVGVVQPDGSVGGICGPDRLDGPIWTIVIPTAFVLAVIAEIALVVLAFCRAGRADSAPPAKRA